MILMVPQDLTLYPTLGGQVCDFMEQNLVFGPGDLRGQPLVLDDEQRALIYRLYEVHPKGHVFAGRRRFKRGGISLAKGLRKTELAALIACCELHPEAPVRCTGFTRGGEPIGGPVSDPYIPFVAYTAEQSDELAYGALKSILENSTLRDDFDIGLDRILRKKGDGKAVSLSSNPNARDGARTTFCVMDETHLWTLPRLKLAHQVMLANLSKRKLSDPWMLETTTAPEPGAGSVAEATMEFARALEQGRVHDTSLFYFHRQAGDEHDLRTAEGARAAVMEASGASWVWRDIEAIVSLWSDPTADRAYWERVWCNRLVQGSTQAFDVEAWKRVAKPESPVKPGDLIVLGFDGAMFHDSTALVGTHVVTGYQWPVGVWECPPGKPPGWKVPAEQVDALVRDCFSRYNVWRLYADPPYWDSWVSLWIGLYGKERVHEWWTNRPKPMAFALRSFKDAIKEGTISHAGDPATTRHIGNSRRSDLGFRDDEGKPLWTIQKERHDSPNKIDIAMASVLSWEARNDAIAAGATKEKEYQLLIIGGKPS